MEKQTTVATAETLSAVADPLAALCAQDPTIRERVGAACDTAAQAVVAAPVVAAAARDGRNGAAGTAGLDGAAGIDGRDGRGITSTAIVAGRLVLTYSDGTTQDVGAVVGADGKAGVDGKPGADGQPGQPGADGAAGAAGAPGGLPASYTTFFTDGTSQTCTRSGGDDSAPRYSCGDRG